MSGASKSAFETYHVNIWDARKGPEHFKKRDETRTVSFVHPQGECCVCYDDSGLRLPCGHFICPDDLLVYAWGQITHLKHQISCFSCTSIIEFADIIKFGLPSDEEKQFLEAAISINFYESQDIQLCPGCQSYCKRVNSEQPQVICANCTKKQGKQYEFCWYCLREWKNAGNYKECGNLECFRETIDELRKSPQMDFKDKNGKVVFVPKKRACPECFTVIQHEGGCNEMTCNRCGNKFCFICLAKTREGSLVCRGRNYTEITCTAAPIQTKLRK